MNEFELNGRLLEISLVLGCDVLDLIYIKEVIKHRGFTADDKDKLLSMGIPMSRQDSFISAILDLSDKLGIVSSGTVNTLSFRLRNSLKNTNTHD